MLDTSEGDRAGAAELDENGAFGEAVGGARLDDEFRVVPPNSSGFGVNVGWKAEEEAGTMAP